jgi:hypothetical protein
MKRLACIMILAGLVPAVQAAQVWFDDAGDLSPWNVSEKAPGYITSEATFADVDANGQEFFLSSWNEPAATVNGSGSWTDMWRYTGVIIQAEKEYTLTLKMASWDDGLEGDEVGVQPAGAGDQIYASLWDDVGGYTQESYIWPDNSTGDSQGYANYSLSFDTYGGNNAASVGEDLGVEISASADGEWWNSFSISEMSIDVVPEPATFGLVGFFGVGLFFARRHFRD